MQEAPTSKRSVSRGSSRKELLELGINVKIIEEKREACEELADRLPGAMIIHADGSNEEIVKEEGIDECDALVCLTGMDEENIVLGLIGKQLGVRKAIVKVNRTPLKLIADPLPIDTIVDPKSISASQIVGYKFVAKNPHACVWDESHISLDIYLEKNI